MSGSEALAILAAQSVIRSYLNEAALVGVAVGVDASIDFLLRAKAEGIEIGAALEVLAVLEASLSSCSAPGAPSSGAGAPRR